jgi:hypothetical protein
LAPLHILTAMLTEPQMTSRRKEAQLLLEQHVAGREQKCANLTASAERRVRECEERERQTTERELALRRREDRIKAAEEGWRRKGETAQKRDLGLEQRERQVRDIEKDLEERAADQVKKQVRSCLVDGTSQHIKERRRGEI